VTNDLDDSDNFNRRRSSQTFGLECPKCNLKTNVSEIFVVVVDVEMNQSI
jgi:hypothetical protein